jgi:hypothetical protein
MSAAVGDCLADVGLAAVWAATGPRPLRGALDALDPSIADLLNASALAEPGPVSPNLRVVANLDSVKRARRLENAQRAVRAAIGALVRSADPRMDHAIAARPHPGPICAALLALNAWPAETVVPRPRIAIPIGDAGAVPGHPASSLLDGSGPWADGWPAAAELDPAALPASLAALRSRIERGELGSLEVPDSWLAGRRWATLWARAH